MLSCQRLPGCCAEVPNIPGQWRPAAGQYPHHTHPSTSSSLKSLQPHPHAATFSFPKKPTSARF